MRRGLLTRAACASAFLLAACGADAAPTPYDEGKDAAWIGAVLEEQWLLLDPVLGASMLAGTMLAGWNSHLRRQIAKRQRAERALRAAAQSAQSACRAKSDFLAIASHEIRTPLNAVAGMLELGLKEAAAGQDVSDHLRVAHGAAQGLLDLVTDILDLEKMDCGKLELLPQRVNLRALAASVVQVFQGLAGDKGLALRFHAEADADVDLMLDPMRFKQVLSNLLSNAVKFTPSGSITVSVGARRVASGRSAVSVRVTDTGIGIAKADQRVLFAPYSQAPDGARIHGGSGLGLNIARRLVALMGGTLLLESAAGRGCTVRFGFETECLASPPPHGQTGQAGDIGTTRLQILAVDDHAPSRLLLRKQLEHLGHSVVQAGSGKAAWRLWRAGAYDAVITDCNMADGSGYDLARRIRRDEAARGLGPSAVWAYTASAERDEIGRCLAAGMDGCLFKPLGLVELQRRLCRSPQARGALRPAWRHGLRFDPGAIETVAAGDAAIAGRFLAGLLQTSEHDAATLRLAVSARDDAAARDVLHALNGVARMIGATALADACAGAERRLACGGGPAARLACRAAQEELRLLVESVRAWVETLPDDRGQPLQA
ncbi:ATP-binding protein [Bordetella bronchialis]|uniref:ATP-binding protein n=1 Tax=Bordetella bronchialis TaxID=463025 RepID=UPI003CFC1A4A